jgi:RHS repeat-associated protein
VSLLNWVRQACGRSTGAVASASISARVALQLSCAVLAAASWSTAAFGQSTSTSERFFNSAAEAQNACTAQPVEYYCGPDGQLYQSACNSIAGPHGAGLTTVTRVEMSKPAGMGACYYSAGSSLKYTYFVWKDGGCPAGTAFVGPSSNDCVNTAFTTWSANNQKGCGGGGGNGDDGTCHSDGTASADTKEPMGNPINSTNGNKVQREVDFEPAGNGVPGFYRTYNSLELRDIATLGVGWVHNWSMRLERTGNTINVLRPDGSSQNFTFAGTGYGAWTGDADTKLKLTSATDGYELAMQDGTVERYSSMGALLSVQARNGQVTLIDQSQGVITSVTGPFGHRIVFNWSGGRLVSIQDPAGNTISFSVDGNRNLVSVSYPDSSVRRYLYEAAYFVHGLTGIIDGMGTRISTYAYDTSFLAVYTERYGGVNKHTLSFAGAVGYITDAFNRVVTKVRAAYFGLYKTTGIANSTDSKTVSKSYDSAGNVASLTNEEGQTTVTSYDAVNRLVSRTLASGTPIAATTQIAFADPFVAVPLTIAEPSVRSGYAKSTTYNYGDTRFPLLPTSVTVAGFTPAGQSVSRTTGMAYNSSGQLSFIDGPRVDAIDTTTIEYWQCATGGSCGQLKRITNAVGQSMTLDAYDGAGRLTHRTAIDGVVTTYSYNSRGKAASITETAGTLTRTTSFSYDLANRLYTASLPSGQVLTYTWDGADQLISVADQLGNTVAYGYDLRGNRTSQTVKDGGGNVATQASMVYNARSYLQSITTAGGTTSITTDALGNPTEVTDPKGQATSNQFDALNRLWKSINSLSGTTTGSFTPGGDLAQLTTPNGAAFGFTVDDLGNQLQESSPDRGTVTKTYDAAGNLKTRTDARGVTVTYGFDAMNRLTQVTYPSSVENTAYTYDSCRPGRLCQVADASGTHAYQYDLLGRQSLEVWTASAALGGHVFTTSYTWTPFDQPSTITSPSGRVVSYSYDQIGRVEGASSGSQTLVSGRTYRAHGALASQTFGNGIIESRTYDTAGRLATWQIGGIETRSYGRDLNGNITSITTSGVAKNYSYDAIDRLLSEAGQSFGWDSNGNRTSDAAGGYAYQAASNRMTSSPAGSVGIDAAGNTTSVGSRSYTYSDGGRLVQALNSGAVVGAYVYRADGLRAAKTTGAGTALFHWDLSGNLLEETSASGSVGIGYAWIESVPVVQWQSAGPVAPIYLHADHLGAARIATTSSSTVAWRWDSTAFGSNTPIGPATVNLRFPGQYADQETGLNQNWHRTYDPSIGRYLESDPIGAGGGANTFGYVSGNPLVLIDPQGLVEMCVRMLQVPIPGARHCFAQFNGDKSDTLSFDPSGVKKDPGIWPATCTSAVGDNDSCVRQEMQKCQAADYDFTKFNCCHCVQAAFDACGISVPSRSWPNWPINPAPKGQARP